MWFGIVQVVNLVLSWIVGFYVAAAMLPSMMRISSVANPSPADVGAALGTIFQMLEYVIPIGGAIGLASLAILTSAFRQFARVDRGKFRVPTIFMIVMMVAEVVAVALLIPFFNSIPAFIAQAPTTGGNSFSPEFAAVLGSFLMYVSLLGICGILGVVGYVGGLILGLWMVGARYDETIIKLGWIFTVIPVLNIAAPILVIVGAHSARNKLA